MLEKAALVYARETMTGRRWLVRTNYARGVMFRSRRAVTRRKLDLVMRNKSAIVLAAHDEKIVAVVMDA